MRRLVPSLLRSSLRLPSPCLPSPYLALVILALAASSFAPPRLVAGDWPQILGPNRNGQAIDEKPLAPWPAAGPDRVWTAPLGQGYAGPIVVGQRVVVFHRVGGQERAEAFDAATGRSLWQTDFPAEYGGGINDDKGPRCVPLAHDGAVYLFGAAGDLHCVSLATGQKRWSRAAYADYNGDLGYFGAGATPIVAGDKLLVNVGGARSGAGIVAFALDTGKTVWQATKEAPSYSSPALATIDGRPTAVFVTRLNCVAIDPNSGEVRFSFPFGQRGPTVNAATPLVFDGQLFLSASYGIGALQARLRGDGVERIWANDESMSSQFSTCVHHRGHLYGTHGREDFANGELRCVQAATGRVLWSKTDTGVGHTLLIGDQLLVLSTEGRLTLARATPEKFEPLASHRVASGTTRAIPAFSGGRLYFRANVAGKGELHCWQLGAK